MFRTFHFFQLRKRKKPKNDSELHKTISDAEVWLETKNITEQEIQEKLEKLKSDHN